MTVNSKRAKRKQPPDNGAKQKSFQASGDWQTEEGEPISYAEVIWRNIDRFMSKTLEERLQELIDFLENQGSKADKKIAGRLRRIAAKIGEMDSHWDANGIADEMAESVGFYVEEMLPDYLRAVLYQLMIEGLIASEWMPQPYKETIRLVAGLESRMSARTDDFLTQLLTRLIDAPRRKHNQVTPGGSESLLRQCVVMLCFHYDQLLPIWRDVKKEFKKYGGGEQGCEAIRREYHDLGAGKSWASKPEYVGLPDGLVEKLVEDYAYASSPEHLAYRHAAFLCGFNIDQYSVKQIKRIVSEYKKKLAEYKS